MVVKLVYCAGVGLHMWLRCRDYSDLQESRMGGFTRLEMIEIAIYCISA
jgi:hypothetical protein